MHTLTITTKFALGDRVRFDSPTQRCSGTGTVEAIVVYSHGRRDYMIALDEFDEFDVQPGILEAEITLLGSGEAV